jgi:pteridine reductase
LADVILPFDSKPLEGKFILITGAARRVGLCLARAVAGAGAGIVLHYNKSREEADTAGEQIRASGSPVFLLQADLANLSETEALIPHAIELTGSLYGLVNNASIFQPLSFEKTAYQVWSENLMIHMSVPFLLSQAFASTLSPGSGGRIINMLDWRALRPSSDHFAYTISKAGLAAMTRSMAAALAPRISVNGLALGAILPPEGQSKDDNLTRKIPLRRWGDLSEVQNALLFLLTGPAYITGEIIHIDGGRHLI